eukprot:TRINITY_DN128_c0_g1_i10.p1 TRINITY_DN128_c0_g1~~TRINITY_DN128_c0_g1_i10.p1  ORF type:complete len:105 (+),score=64.54 TRINITY_DN128_c0_g1_i10:46-315(+)
MLRSLVGSEMCIRDRTYTKPKKIKHKRKKMKLTPLRFYRVEDDDKAGRMRRECPKETCGAGIFMAQHFDRQYCGKCHLTYMYAKDENKN